MLEYTSGILLQAGIASLYRSHAEGGTKGIPWQALELKSAAKVLRLPNQESVWMDGSKLLPI